MDVVEEGRQNKSRAKLKGEVKRQRTFFLSDEAMDSLKRRQESSNAPSINHALESLLTSQSFEATPSLKSQMTCDQQAILNQASIVCEHYAALISKPKGKRLSEEKALFVGLNNLTKLVHRV